VENVEKHNCIQNSGTIDMFINNDDIVKHLEKCGLFASVRQEGNLEVIGGTDKIETSILSTFRNGFSVRENNDSWLILLPDKGQLDIEKYADSIEEALKIVCNYYSSLPIDFFS